MSRNLPQHGSIKEELARRRARFVSFPQLCPDESPPPRAKTADDEPHRGPSRKFLLPSFSGDHVIWIQEIRSSTTLCCAFNAVHVPSAQRRVGTNSGHPEWERDGRFWQLDSLLDAADEGLVSVAGRTFRAELRFAGSGGARETRSMTRPDLRRQKRQWFVEYPRRISPNQPHQHRDGSRIEQEMCL